MNGNTNSATVGIIDQNGNYGLEPAYNQNGFFQDEMSVLFDTAPTWLNILSNQSGQIPEEESLSIGLLSAFSTSLTPLTNRENSSMVNEAFVSGPKLSLCHVICTSRAFAPNVTAAIPGAISPE